MIAFAIALTGCRAASRTHAPIQPSDSAVAVAVGARFHSALGSGDSAAALGLLDRDAIILESGAVETRDEYRSHHLPADIECARAVKSKQSILIVSRRAESGWKIAAIHWPSRARRLAPAGKM